METAELIDAGFTVADANKPDLTTAEGNLRIRFTQWDDSPTQVLFVDAVAHRWGPMYWDGELEGEDFDATHIIHQSKWLQSICAPEAGYKHYRLNFNAAGCLEVIARGITVELGGDGATEHATGKSENGGLENPPDTVRSGDPTS